MTGYTKLFSSILDSTIWQEPNHIRLVWITMLAMADKNSVVEAAIPGLAKRAMVTVEECIEALNRFKEPDPYSRTKDHEGRRIEDVPGGWFLLNHGAYRDLVTLQEKRKQAAERARRYRERKKERDERDASRDITPPSPSPSPTTSPKKVGKEPPTKEERKKPAHSLPDEWTANAKHLEIAREKGITLVDEVIQFRDYAKSRDWKKVDWDATFNNWLRKTSTFSKQGNFGERFTAAEQQQQRNAAAIEAFRNGED